MNFLAPIPNPNGAWQNAAGARFAIFGGTTLATSAPVTAAASTAAFAASQGLTLVNPPAPPTPQQTFDAAVAAGFTYPVPNSNPALTLILDLSDGARAQFTGLMVLLNAMMQEGQILATSTQAIADKAGTLHLLTVAQIQTMLLAYGAAYAGLFNALHAATTAATPAT